MIKEGVMINERYEVINQIGVGGMADVYKAIDHKLNRYVAIKVLKREFREDELFVKKFQTEAQSAAGLIHPNIVTVYDVGEDHGIYYIVMELVEGITLKEYIKKKVRLTPKEVISIAVQVCMGIEMAHKHNIVHRDIKPQNIMISKAGKVKVTDFGIAKATSSNTISTNAMGSVHYTSPEQARGGFSDGKSDIYSLGITMFEMITGELPFDGDSTVSIALKHLQEDIINPSQIVDNIPYSLEQIILKCTQKSPDRRYADVVQLARDLRRSLSEPDGNFVVISPVRSAANTVVITPEEMSRIQSAAHQNERYDDYEEDSYSDLYDEEDDGYAERRARRRATKKKEIDPKMVKIMRIMTVVVSVIFIFIVIYLVGVATNLFSFGPGIKSEKEEATVPLLLGMSEAEAKEACEELGYVLSVAGQELSDRYEEGLVCRQSSAEGAKLEEGSNIKVYISSGLKGKEISVPKVENMTKEKAIATLVQAGFKEANITTIEREDDTIEAGKVIGTTPEAGSKATEKTSIIIVISVGAEKAIVPKLTGKTQEEAEEALKKAGLKGHAIEKYSSVEAGKVIEQKTASGEQVDKDTVIEYVVSKGEEPPKMVTIPTNLVGKSASSVKATLEGLGFKVRENQEANSQYEAGLVVYVEGEGHMLEPGSVVNIVVSKGPEVPTPPEVTPDDGSGN